MASYRGRGTHGQTVEVLGARIVAGRIPEGGTLDIGGLGAELDISLTALREALKVLAGKGLVDARQRRGTFVRERAAWNLLDSDVIRWQSEAGGDAAFVRDLTEMRAVVEPAAARYAALRRTAADLTALEAALAAMAADGEDAAAAATADVAFHRALLAASGNALLMRLDMFLEPGLFLRDLLVHRAGSADDPVPGHADLVAAVRAGDPDTAETLMRGLLEKAAADVRRLQGPSVAGPDGAGSREV
ncbi:FadR/GntR family transcriptional regulator [Streptomyces sp. NPDC059740]|uniref:FadR/GntR family transcriptional regulator n=1 Tax=Streptomyces sp. NPDC059740 TaxID=3346926 RepID=UPI00366132EC